MKTIYMLSVLVLLASTAFAGDRDSMWEKAYPKAEKGFVRHVLHLQEQKDEDARKVELIVGKTVETDGVNRFFFSGSIKEKIVPGWGYPRYDAEAGELASTMMGVPPGQSKVAMFVTIGGGPHLVRYNSRLPIVVYAPEGFEVRYRFWQAGAETMVIPAE